MDTSNARNHGATVPGRAGATFSAIRVGHPSGMARHFPRTFLVIAVAVVASMTAALPPYPVQHFSAKSGLAGAVVRGIAKTPDGTYWFTCWGRGVSSYDGIRWKSYSIADGLLTPDVRYVETDQTGRLWVGGIGGLAYWTGERWQPVPTSLPGLESPSVFVIHPMRDGSIWFGLDAGEVIAFEPAADNTLEEVPRGTWSLKLPRSVSRSTIGVAGLHQRADGTILCGTEGAGIVRWNGTEWYQEPGDESLQGVVSFCEVGDGSLFAGGRSGLWQSGPDGSGWVALSVEPVKAIAAEADGQFAVAYARRVVYRRGAEEYGIPLLKDHEQFSTQFLRHFPESGETWVGTKLGLYRIGEEGWMFYSNAVEGFWPRSDALYADSAIPATMVDTAGRVHQYLERRWREIGGVEPGPYRAIVRGINGSLWMVGDGHAVRWDPQARVALERLELPAGARSILESPSGILAAWGPDEFFQRVDGAWRETPLRPAPGSGRIQDAILTKRDELIVSTLVALSHWKITPGGEISLLHRVENDKNYRGLLEEDDGTVLVGLNEDGVYAYRDGALTPRILFEHDPSARVSCLYRGPDGSLVTGSLDLGIARYYDGRWQWYGDMEGFPTGIVRSIHGDPEGGLWAMLEGVGVLHKTPDPQPPETEILQLPEQVPHGEQSVARFSGADRWEVTAREDLAFSVRIRPADESGDQTPWSPFTRETTLVTPRLGWGDYIFEVRASDSDFNVDPTPAAMVFTVLPPLWATPAVMLPMALLACAALAAAGMVVRQNATLRLSEQRLRESKERAEAASRAKSRFLTQVSHEFRTPMNAIMGHAQLLQNSPHLDAEEDEGLDIILRSGEHLIEIINNILEAAQIESGAIKLTPTVFRLRDLTEDLFKILSGEYDSTRVHLRQELDAGIPEYLLADQGKLRRILINLLGNAIRFTPRGEITLRISSARRYGLTGQLQLTFVVEDSGVGIEFDALNRVFEPFEQAAAGRQAGGAGLGLSICKRLAEAMGGTITLSSSVGGGTTVILSVPVSEAPADPVGAPPREAGATAVPESSTRKRILVADDIDMNLNVMNKLLNRAGFDVVAVTSGSEAVARVASDPPDLILMDRAMPNMDGIEATRQIRATEVGRTIPIIFVTGGVLDEELEEILEPGLTDVMLKPYRQSELMEKIRRHLYAGVGDGDGA